jgi:hypothetical protein
MRSVLLCANDAHLARAAACLNDMLINDMLSSCDKGKLGVRSLDDFGAAVGECALVVGVAINLSNGFLDMKRDSSLSTALCCTGWRWASALIGADFCCCLCWRCC